jgi:hypothetical protein
MSSSTILIRGSDVVENSNNSTYRYKLPYVMHMNEYDQVSLQNINIYFSWVNISNDYNNNSFQYWWPDSAGTFQKYTVTLSDGYYSISDINESFITFMTAKGHYLVNVSTSAKTFYAEIVTNATSYATQIKTYSFPASSTIGFSDTYTTSNKYYYPYASTAIASVKWIVTTTNTPQVVINSTNNFKTVLGFNAGTYPSSNQTSNYSVLSQNTPVVDKVSSVLVCCNLIHNVYCNPSTLLYSFTSGNASYGSQINVEPKFLTYDSVRKGDYSFIEVSFYDQDGNQLKIKDTNLLVVLSIRNTAQLKT